MTYSPNIPQATDNPSNSQPLILENFQQLNTQFGTDTADGTGGDHVLFNAVLNNGKHNRVTLLNQSGAVAGVTQAAPNQNLIYGVTNDGTTMPYYTRDNLTTVYPVSPIKAYASFTSLLANGNITPNDSFNMAPSGAPVIVQNMSGSTVTWTITLINACRTVVYGVVAYYGALGPINITREYYAITSTSVFTISILTNFTILPATFPVTVMVLET